jgi:hypothetical protein
MIACRMRALSNVRNGSKADSRMARLSSLIVLDTDRPA